MTVCSIEDGTPGRSVCICATVCTHAKVVWCVSGGLVRGDFRAWQAHVGHRVSAMEWLPCPEFPQLETFMWG